LYAGGIRVIKSMKDMTSEIQVIDVKGTAVFSLVQQLSCFSIQVFAPNGRFV
jgi:hypothetical protein